MDINRLIAQELSILPHQVERTLALFAEGGTVPFIARYRKDVTGNLDEVQIRAIEERNGYLNELLERRTAILDSIREQGKLTPELEAQLMAASSKTTLEDLYLPYKPKRRTRAMIARERGLEPLAERLWSQADVSGGLEELAAPFVDLEKDVADAQAALDGARDICAERVSEDASLRADVRKISLEEGFVASKVTDAWAGKNTKFDMYYDFREAAPRIPSHRYLAIARGVEEEVLTSSLEVPVERILALLVHRVVSAPKSVAAPLLREACEDAYHRLMAVSIETDIRAELKSRADGDALKVFQANLRALLLSPPLGGKTVLALDPGFRTGVKVAVVDATGKYLAHDVIYPVPPMEKVDASKRILLDHIKRHKVDAIAIGNGTASRETDSFVRQFLGEHKELSVIPVVVNEAGASVYSASEIAREEFPELDVTIRGAISIGRRLQDPLAELVKIDPKAIGVGQYQHDVNQKNLKKSLEDEVESSVNFVGVEVNTASAALLKYVAGIGESLAKNIVKHRDEHGPFKSRSELRDVTRFGPKAFQQSAGFLRVREGGHPLDNSAVHPEHYGVVEKMAKDLSVPVQQLVGNASLVDRIPFSKYVEGDIGEFTLKDILEELKKPGRDPRKQFDAIAFRADVTEVSHLEVDMVLEGVITNVTDFGCFVDVGVHQDGLVHISRLSDNFVKDPKTVVKAGDRVRVKVLSVDVPRKRISLTLRESDVTGKAQPEEPRGPRAAEGARPAGGGGSDRGGQRPGGSGRPDDRSGARSDGRSDARSDGRGKPQGPPAKPAAPAAPFNNPFGVLAGLKKK